MGFYFLLLISYSISVNLEAMEPNKTLLLLPPPDGTKTYGVVDLSKVNATGDELDQQILHSLTHQKPTQLVRQDATEGKTIFQGTKIFIEGVRYARSQFCVRPDMLPDVKAFKDFDNSDACGYGSRCKDGQRYRYNLRDIDNSTHGIEPRWRIGENTIAERLIWLGYDVGTVEGEKRGKAAGIREAQEYFFREKSVRDFLMVNQSNVPPTVWAVLLTSELYKVSSSATNQADYQGTDLAGTPADQVGTLCHALGYQEGVAEASAQLVIHKDRVTLLAWNNLPPFYTKNEEQGQATFNSNYQNRGEVTPGTAADILSDTMQALGQNQGHRDGLEDGKKQGYLSGRNWGILYGILGTSGVALLTYCTKNYLWHRWFSK